MFHMQMQREQQKGLIIHAVQNWLSIDMEMNLSIIKPE